MNAWLRRLFDLALLGIAGGLAAVLLVLPEPSGDLPARVVAALPDSGVDHAVTAVLLNFRGYDTFLELLVLLLALVGVRSMGALPRRDSSEAPSPVLEELLRRLAPLLVLVAAYLLWVGKQAPGGAFQAGAVLGAAGVLLLLTERPVEAVVPPALLRLLPVLGVLSFALIGAALAVGEGAFLAYPPRIAGTLILVIEGFATLSIATILVMLFVGARSEGEGP